MSVLNVKDLESLQSVLSEHNLDYQMELVEGKILVIGPSDVYASEVGALVDKAAGKLG